MAEYIVTAVADPKYPFDDEYGKGHYLREAWTMNGKLHRYVGPAVVIRHPGTLLAIREEFYWQGKLHRHGDPAIIVRNPDTGHIEEVQYYLKGRAVPGPNRVVPDAPSC
jgi:hypothetical protein